MATDRAASTGGYRVDVVRSGAWWAITVPALDGVFSQSKRLDQVEDAAREAISLMLEIDEGDVGDLDVVDEPIELLPHRAVMRGETTLDD